jgi:hypothetical protein
MPRGPILAPFGAGYIDPEDLPDVRDVTEPAVPPKGLPRMRIIYDQDGPGVTIIREDEPEEKAA